MGKTGKILLGLVVAVIAVIALVATLVLSNLDDIIKQVIEGAGSKAIGTTVTLDSATLSPEDGRGELRGLTIANPAGYDSDYAFRMEQIVLEVDPASITADVIVIRDILIDGAVLLAEQKAASTNLKDLLNNMSAASKPAPGAAPEPTQSSPEVRLMVEKFRFINNRATLITSQWGDRSLDIPDINMKDIGSAETGLTPQQLANRMTAILLKRAEKAVTNHLEQLAKEAANKELKRQMDKNLSEDDKQKVNALKSLFKKK